MKANDSDDEINETGFAVRFIWAKLPIAVFNDFENIAPIKMGQVLSGKSSISSELSNHIYWC